MVPPGKDVCIRFTSLKVSQFHLKTLDISDSILYHLSQVRLICWSNSQNSGKYLLMRLPVYYKRILKGTNEQLIEGVYLARSKRVPNVGASVPGQFRA